MKKHMIKKAFMVFLLIFSIISVASLGYKINIPAHISSGYVNEWISNAK